MDGKNETAPQEEEITATGDSIVIAAALDRIADGLGAIATAIVRLAEAQSADGDEFDPFAPTEL